MSLRREAIFWGGLLALFIGFLYLFSSILPPFAAGLIIAYLLDPFADRLQAIGLPRWAAAGLAILSMVLAGMIFLPIVGSALYSQVSLLLQTLPDYRVFVDERLSPLFQLVMERLDEEQAEQLRQGLAEFGGTVVDWITDFLSGLLDSGLALLQVVGFLIITPVVAFYLLRDYDTIFKTLSDWLPRDEAETIRALVGQMNDAIAGFIRGQLLVALTLGVLYAIALSIVGLNGGLLIGFIVGVFSVVPYVGTFSGLFICIIIAAFQFGTLSHVLIVAAIFGAGQLLEDYVLIPRWTGQGAGLHAVVVIFALLAGGQLFGFAGVLLGVPLAAVIAILLRFAIRKYLDSRFFKGDVPADGPLPPADPAAERA